MKSLALLAALTAAAPASAVEPPEGRIYLLSIGGIDLAKDESVTGFSIASWGVDWLALCRIPPGWRLRAGRNATPDGLLEGESTHGVTRLADPDGLRELALVRLWGPVQWRARAVENGIVPATLAGRLSRSEGPEVALGERNLRLTPAAACPAPAADSGDDG